VAPPAPLVPANGLLIQGGLPNPVAYAALSYDLAGLTAGKLTLAVAPNAGTTPAAKVKLCPLSAPTFSPEQGGPMADAPAYDCKTSVAAGPNAQGTAYDFSVTTLVSNDALAVAILPVDPTTRVVFSQPSEDSLATEQSAVEPTTPEGPVDTSTPPAAPSADTGQAQPPVASGPVVPMTTAPAGAPAPAVAPTQVPTAFAAAPVSSTTHTHAAQRVVIGLLVAAVCVAALSWAFAGHSAASRPLDAPGATSD
jgi:hypothetical protein